VFIATFVVNEDEYILLVYDVIYDMIYAMSV